MLEQILCQVQDFEHKHGRHPTVVFVNQRDFAQLRAQYPDIFQEQAEIMLGFHIQVVPNEVLAQPEVAWVPIFGSDTNIMIAQALAQGQPILQDAAVGVSVLH